MDKRMKDQQRLEYIASFIQRAIGKNDDAYDDVMDDVMYSPESIPAKVYLEVINDLIDEMEARYGVY